MLTPPPSASNQLTAAQLISQGRSLTMGFATLCILLFHQPFVHQPRCITAIWGYGHWGVELFLFLSGFGIYYALKKTEARETWSFYRKRFLRLLAVAIPAGILLDICNPFFHGHLVSTSAPYGLTPVVCLFGLHLWYVRAILLAYFFSPFIYRILYRPLFVIMIAIASAGIGFILSLHFHCLHDHLIYTSVVWPLLRFPAYLLGMKVAEACSTPNKWSNMIVHHPIVLLLLGVVGLAFAVYSVPCSYQYFFLLPMVLFISLAFGHLAAASFQHVLCRAGHHALCVCLSWIGKRSLEFYIVHLMVYHGLRHLDPGSNAAMLLLSWLIITLLVILIHEAATCISNFLFFRNKAA